MHLKFIERKERNTKEEIYSDLEQALLNRLVLWFCFFFFNPVLLNMKYV
jgi:hypothetical protein